ncbi:MAG: T9SS type A sorting domain-containing protein, partial [Bacteroidetes bacterium]|nr:T9SS type A sorting domain-containing protein [Bacteroidota bacterium]
WVSATTWVNSGQDIFTYDASSHELTHLGQLWNGTAWTNWYKTTHTWDAAGNNTSYVRLGWNTAGTNIINGDSCIYFYSKTTGIASLSTSPVNLVVYPNPTNNHINISLWISTPQTVSYILYNTIGQVINSQTLKNTDGNVITEMNFSQIPTGLYYLTVKGQGWVKTEKIIITQ